MRYCLQWLYNRFGWSWMSQVLKPIKWYKKLSSRQGRLETGFFLVEGERAIRQVIDVDPGAVEEILATGDLEVSGNYPVRVLTRRQFDQVAQSKTPQGIMAVIRLPLESYSEQMPEKSGSRVLLLEDIQDPGNVGTLIRTAAGFDFSGVIMSEKCADPFSAKCVQAAAGCVLSGWIRRSAGYLQMASRLKKAGYSLVATSPEAKGSVDKMANDKLVLALGNESAGLSEELLQLSTLRFSIPINRERAESLNVAVSGAIAMYLAGKK